eukprot:CAMPEP_0176451354 /NCGR_PEP_ID=MMETSP0127-20121128/27780_1 /TAXON_ID=938130 /ORGANISM="Platyophrya macrostoma, Strain WH" /LENGTH=256 /DNA_ID=CAMNT_0017839381 /DNA_START=31 /DNA_END=801 /DNA_ORIENTATION=-
MISGKLGGTVIAQEELASLFSDNRNQKQPLHGQFQQQLNLNLNQQQNYYQGQNMSNNIQQSRDPLQYINFRYTNPLKPQVNQDFSVGANILQIYNSIQVPAINNLGKILQNCETTRDNYSSLLSMSQELSNEGLPKTKSEEQKNPGIDKRNSTDSHTSGPWGRASHGTKESNSNQNLSNNPFLNAQNNGYGGSMQNNNYPSQNSGYPSSMKISSVVREQDINSFIAKFQCTRATAIGYLEAFGSYENACKEYANNS